MNAEMVADAIQEMRRGGTRGNIFKLQSEMLKIPEKVDCPVRHIFAPGVYAREIAIPKGSLVVGKIHRHRHVNIISKGTALVVTEFGSERLSAPCSFVSEVGTKRAVYAEEDIVWTTIHPTEETDLGKIEEIVIAESYDALDAPPKTELLEGVIP